MDAETPQTPALPGRLTNLRSRRARAQDGPPTSVFVLGTMFSGSTLIGRDMTTRIKKAHYVGELHNYTQVPVLSHPESGAGCGMCNITGKNCRHFTDELKKEASYEDIFDIHRRLARSLDASVVIDGSKFAAWLQRALRQQGSDPAQWAPVKAIITVRNPVAYSISNRNRTGDPLWRSAGLWRDTYVDALRTVNISGLPSMVVRYEDYMANRDASLRRLAAFFGLPLESEPDNSSIHDTGGNWSSYVPYVNRDQFERHIERLGAGRESAESFMRDSRAYWNDAEPKEDTRWHGSLQSGEANVILSTPGLSDVANLLGYNVAEVVHRAVRNP
ncbi:hypothetical protein ACFQ07_29380 [Actinomadura adrarensis]|uniref:Sulfotransferase n=1 Tax=Actinomadura adrarensis TaxID=1819600 RepID=A0ABW3CPR7_9ACTN